MDWTFYRDLFGGWRWEARGENGEVFDSAESYDTREDCVRAAEDARTDVQSRMLRAHSDTAEPARSLLCVMGARELRRSLEEELADFDVTYVDRAEDAIRRLNTRVFNAYLLDYWIPDWSGVHLCREIRRTDPHGPVIFYTNAGTEEQRKRALRAGANAYVCAPAGVATLREELSALLQAAELTSSDAVLAAQQAIQDELRRRSTIVMTRSEAARRVAAEAAEKAAKLKARTAFVLAGGTSAVFERRWPEEYKQALSGNPPSRSGSNEAASS